MTDTEFVGESAPFNAAVAQFDLPTPVDLASLGVELPSTVGPQFEREQPKVDPMRPALVRGRYQLPHPVTGKPTSWQRTSNLIKLAEDVTFLEAWKRRNVAKGLAMRPDLVDVVQRLDVKADKDQLNAIVEKCEELAGAYKMSDEGTKLHKSAELADLDGGSLRTVPERHHTKIRLYLDALRAYGITITPGMIERMIVSTEYEVGGTFDRIGSFGNGSHRIVDLKTSDSLDLSAPSISGQLDCYRNGVNAHGVWDGRRYDDSIKVADDFALVVHLPSTRDEVTIYEIDLAEGRAHNQVCLSVRKRRRVKAKHVMRVFQPDAYRAAGAEVDQAWLELANAAHTIAELMSIRDRARAFGQYTDRLADQFRVIAGEITAAELSMGS